MRNETAILHFRGGFPCDIAEMFAENKKNMQKHAFVWENVFIIVAPIDFKP